MIDMKTMTVVSNFAVGKNPVEMAALPAIQFLAVRRRHQQAKITGTTRDPLCCFQVFPAIEGSPQLSTATPHPVKLDRRSSDPTPLEPATVSNSAICSLNATCMSRRR